MEKAALEVGYFEEDDEMDEHHSLESLKAMLTEQEQSQLRSTNN